MYNIGVFLRSYWLQKKLTHKKKMELLCKKEKNSVSSERNFFEKFVGIIIFRTSFSDNHRAFLLSV